MDKVSVGSSLQRGKFLLICRDGIIGAVMALSTAGNKEIGLLVTGSRIFRLVVFVWTRLGTIILKSEKFDDQYFFVLATGTKTVSLLVYSATYIYVHYPAPEIDRRVAPLQRHVHWYTFCFRRTSLPAIWRR